MNRTGKSNSDLLVQSKKIGSTVRATLLARSIPPIRVEHFPEHRWLILAVFGLDPLHELPRLQVHRNVT